MGIEVRPRPPVIAQGTAPQCWAAATASWLQLNLSRTQLDKKQLVERYGDPKKGGSLGHLSPKWVTYIEDFNLTYSEQGNIRSIRTIEKEAKDSGSPISKAEAVARFNRQGDTFLRDTRAFLNKKAYGLFMFAHTRSRLHGVISHMVVLFGIHRVGGEPNLIVMDPAKNAVRDLPMSEIFDLRTVILSAREERTLTDKPVVSGVPREDT